LSSDVDQSWRSGPVGGLSARLARAAGFITDQVIAPYSPGPLGILGRALERIRTPELALLSILCDPQKTSIDIGASNGAFALEAAGFSASCIAFEPDIARFHLLRKASPRGMLVEHGVAANVNGTITVQTGDPVRNTQFHIPAKRLDDCAFGEIGFLKIDTADQEDAVLDGAVRILAIDRPALLVTLEEKKKPFGIAPTVERLAKMGYRGFFLADRKILGISQFYPDVDQPLSPRLRRKRYIKRFIFVHESDARRLTALSAGDLASARRIMDVHPEREFTVGELAGQIYAGRLIIATCAVLGFLAALAYIFETPRLYSATMTIGRNIHDTSQSAVSQSGASQLVRSLTGAGDTDDKYQRFMFTLTSNRTAMRLERKLDLLHTANKDNWDPVTKTWKRPHGLRFEFDQRLDKLLGLPTWKPPSAEDFSGYLAGVLTYTSTATSGVYRLEVLHREPQMARTILQNAFVETNELFREEDRKSAEQTVAYVNNKLATTTGLEDRQALTANLVEAEHQLVMINIEPNYVAEPLNDLSVSNGPVRPFVMLALMLGPVIGFFIGVLVALFHRQRP
jgi:hypothetical protein